MLPHHPAPKPTDRSRKDAMSSRSSGCTPWSTTSRERWPEGNDDEALETRSARSCPTFFRPFHWFSPSWTPLSARSVGRPDASECPVSARDYTSPRNLTGRKGCSATSEPTRSFMASSGAPVDDLGGIVITGPYMSLTGIGGEGTADRADFSDVLLLQILEVTHDALVLVSSPSAGPLRLGRVRVRRSWLVRGTPTRPAL